MAKFCILFAILILAVVAVTSVPHGEHEVRADRQRRVTCDLMTWGGKVGHSACAAHCLSMGKAGGSCKDGVCHCRK